MNYFLIHCNNKMRKMPRNWLLEMESAVYMMIVYVNNTYLYSPYQTTYLKAGPAFYGGLPGKNVV